LKNSNVRTIDIPDDKLRTYNLDDCTILHRVLPSMLEDAEELGLMNLYLYERMKCIKPVLLMMERGIRLDEKELKKWTIDKLNKCTELEDELRSSAGLPEAFNPGSDDDLRLLLFGVIPNKCRTALKNWLVYNEQIEQLRKEAATISLPPSLKALKLSASAKRKADRMLATKKYKDLQQLVQLGELEPLYVLTYYSGRKTEKEKK